MFKHDLKNKKRKNEIYKKLRLETKFRSCTVCMCIENKYET